MLVKIKPFSHQKIAFEKACNQLGLSGNNRKSKGFALLMEPGTGKTLVAIALINQIFIENDCKKILIFAPKTVLDVWKEEISTNSSIDSNIIVLSGSVKNRMKILDELKTNKMTIVITNYAAARLMSNHLAEFAYDGIVICDESQKVKNYRALQTKAIQKISKCSRYNLIMTGTLMVNNLYDVFSQWKLVNQDDFGMNVRAFRERYMIFSEWNQYIITGYRNMPELHEKIQKRGYRITKEKALDLPDIISCQRIVEMPPIVRKYYDQAKKDGLIKFENEQKLQIQNILVELTKLQQLASGFILLENGEKKVLSDHKIEAIEEILEEYPKEKIVIFTKFRTEIELLKKYFEKKKINCAYLTGSTKCSYQEISKFQNDSSCKIIAVNIQTGSVGITLTSAHIAVFYSLDFSTENYIQAMGRIHRIGQKKKCTYIHLLTKNSIDFHIYQALQRKENMMHSILGDWKNYFN